MNGLVRKMAAIAASIVAMSGSILAASAEESISSHSHLGSTVKM